MLAKMGRRYMRLMTDNKWIVDLEKMGRNLDSLKYREKLMRLHEKEALRKTNSLNLVEAVPNAQSSSNVDQNAASSGQQMTKRSSLKCSQTITAQANAFAETNQYN